MSLDVSLDPNTPVLVGVGVVSQREEDPAAAEEPVALMAEATRRAAADAGSAELLAQASSIRVPRGFWEYLDPGRWVADRVGAKRARTTVAEIGVLQQTLMNDACRAIAAGEEEVALVVGGEAKYRELRAKITETPAPNSEQPGVTPDHVLTPTQDVVHPFEIERGVMMPVRAFAMIENALRFALGRSVEEHRDAVAALWSEFSAIAAGNPHAWLRSEMSAEALRGFEGRNRPMAFPYGRFHNSDWNVDQAGALLFCSVSRAEALGVPRERWIFPLAGTESNHQVALSQRERLDRSPGAKVAGERALAIAGLGVDEIGRLELYSCFPAPVQVFARELGVRGQRPWTVTGGMAFAGGPLNNYVLQSTARMAELLREDEAGATGLVTSVSGFLNKQGYGVWSNAPPAQAPAFEDVSAATAAEAPERALDRAYQGKARVASYTVLYQGPEPSEGIAVCDLPDGRRSIAVTRDPGDAAGMTREELCDREVEIGPEGALRL